MRVYSRNKESASKLEKIIRENGCGIKNFQWSETDCERATVLVSHLEYRVIFEILKDNTLLMLLREYTLCTKISPTIKKECGWK